MKITCPGWAPGGGAMRAIIGVGLILLSELALAQNSVGVLDTSNYRWIGGMHSPYSADVRISADGTRGYVAREGFSDVMVFDAVNDVEIGRVVLIDDSQVVAFSPDSATAYVSSIYASTISIIDVANQAVVNTINVFASSIAFSPDSTRAYAGNAVIDTETQQVVATLPFSGRPWAVTPDGSELY